MIFGKGGWGEGWGVVLAYRKRALERINISYRQPRCNAMS